jgi:predicted nucleic acid-binding protein
MASYVVDATIVIARLIRGPHTPNAQALFRQLVVGDKLIIPEFCLLECTNVLWKTVRFQGMPKDQAKLLLRDLRGLPLRRTPVKQLLDAALEIGLTHSLAIYDSAYIALARRSGYPLITLDQPQSRAAIAEGITLKLITDFN